MKKLSSKKKTDPLASLLFAKPTGLAWSTFYENRLYKCRDTTRRLVLDKLDSNKPGQLFTKIDYTNAETPQDILFWTN